MFYAVVMRGGNVTQHGEQASTYIPTVRGGSAGYGEIGQARPPVAQVFAYLGTMRGGLRGYGAVLKIVAAARRRRGPP